jgi:hypothetical protein
MSHTCSICEEQINDSSVPLGDELEVCVKCLRRILKQDPLPKYILRLAIAKELEGQGKKEKGMRFRTIGFTNNDLPLLDDLPLIYSDEEWFK